MKIKYKITYLPMFYNDLEQIVNYIKYHLENKIAAENFVNELEEKIKQRVYNPESYEKYESSRKREDTYYRIYVKNYTVFYTVKDDTMEIRRILSNRRNFDSFI